MINSPYQNLPVETWESKTIELVKQHPLDANNLYEIVLEVWKSIFESQIGTRPYLIGKDLFPRPQIMAYFLHELIPLELADKYTGLWRREETASEKDLVYIPDPIYSIEIKTSSSPRNIFGNRSYTQKTDKPKKDRSGYYLAINFQKFSTSSPIPQIVGVRFGWLDHFDWIGQAAATGQQARLDPNAEKHKLIKLPV